ncbi:MAG TPA: phage major capsid protein [Firmicutes bacterium]|nr:phage major capsid protein [Bacillota bacterium]
MGDLELRSFELRLEGTENEPVLAGYAVVYNQDSQPLPFIERIRPGAFRSSLESGKDILALVDHDRGKVIGRTSNGTLALREDNKGLLVEIRPNMETTFGRDVVANVKRRDLTNMSFGFVCKKDEWQGDRREVIEAELREVSVVSMPAYTGTTIQKRGGSTMKTEERELRQKLAGLKEQHEALLRKEDLTDEERGQQLELAKEIRTLEAQVAAFQPDTKAPPVAAMSAGQDEQRAAFVNYLRGKDFDTRAMTVGTGTSGGYMAPESFLAEVIRKLEEASAMRRLARTITIGAASVKIPRLTSSVSAAWTAEAAAIAPGDPAFDQVEFTPHKLAAITLVSNELLADSAVAVETFLAGLFAEKIAAVEDVAFLNGTGSGQPKGLLTYAEIEAVTAASATAITADEVIDLYDALPPAYRGNAAWLMHPATMNVLRKLKDTQGQYLLVSGLVAGAPATILGRPVVLTSNMPTIAAGAKTILFGDLARAYYIVDRQGLEVQRSVDRYFEQDLTAFRAIKRTDGQLVLADACRILKQAAV